ncbi:MAG: bifunctional hydroxymethylpyrimidine kinase/phosphomethylpyrimidine kinase [Candidatus Eremiobacteraeota bacterium]|nr:bifunctional hydroxymethylpyrimidine kinase/phosphomethylpyrimidine kinase [Candidatus Eremiobacteraeota bacterium]MBV9055683.1 bifunctional hydroxymethylpyrimidine kinase/phosphomethylpyrimidine kinase [Candidatus Eremiobacteraeota bacterium]MBV9698917.1 bifunctional hydroxymethylpyrimidine kinase/phosphomethylpyrimidine kinase [Candidatus Eremiobacteraeota bacterium]
MMPELMLSPAQTLFERAANLRILVVGDLMIDEWIWGGVTRVSPEAPVPVVAVTDHSFTLGGAGNVANNLRALRAQVLFGGAVGDDGFAAQVRDLLRGESVDDSGIFMTRDRPTTRKTRIVAHNQQVVRADWESTAPLTAEDRHRLASFVAQRAPGCDAVILSDYAKGLLCREIVEAAQACPLVLADPKPQNIGIYAGVTCVAPNVAEASAMTGIVISDDSALETAGMQLLQLLRCRYAVITRGEHGMALFGSAGERLTIPSVARTVYDVSGAGDTVTAVLALGLAGRVPIEQTMQLANFAAGVVVEKLGTATASPEEILALLDPAIE